MRFALIGNNAFSVLNFRGPLLSEIAERGHTVFALAPDFDAHIRDELVALGVTPVDISLSRTGLNPVRDAIDIVSLVRALRGLELDCVLSFAIKPVIYGTLAARMAGVKHRYALIAGLGYAFGDGARSSFRSRAVHHAARMLYRTALSQANAVFMQNPDDANDFVDLGIVGRDKIVGVNGTGVDLDDWVAHPTMVKPITFVLAARLLAEKGIRQYVEAARIIKAEHPDVRFVLLGGLDSNPDGIKRAEVEGWVAEGVLEWPGHVPVRPWLAEVSVFVLPSYYREGVPRSIQEAMASARPIITTDAPGCRETVIEGRNGFLVPPRDAGALADAMRKFVLEPNLVMDMGRESRILAQERFDVHKVNARMMKIMGL
ncbi:glycosyltransferase family 4 protein [Cucumibacter marinus]|uniref:glycosyltransferase family 4 protein n=1 Tax=Cucumibacter marinus TaxID=1121252 RepID=UPI0003FF0953|nr:glycosyltransferase family 4 protein [Cucumibacter marinus]